MEKFISAEEYKKLQERKSELAKEATKKVTFLDRVNLTFMSVFGDKESTTDFLESTYDKINRDKDIKELKKSLKNATIEEIMPSKDFNALVDALKTMDAEADEFMRVCIDGDKFGEPFYDSLKENMLFVNGLLEETNSSLSEIKMYYKNNEYLSIELTSIEENGTKHEFKLNFEEDKIYHTTISSVLKVTKTEEEYISDKKKELEIENFDGMSL